MEPLERARLSLIGLSVGDAFGGNFEFDSVDWDRPKRVALKRTLPSGPWRYTDDTQMALSIYEILRKFEHIEPGELADSFSQNFDISRGYGLSTEKLLSDMISGGDWKQLAASLFGGSGSFGNGAAMRVAPVGAYFAHQTDSAIENARQSAMITHTHPDAVAGAIAVTIGAAQAYQLSLSGFPPNQRAYWDAIIKAIPSGEVKNAIHKAANLHNNITTQQASEILGCGWDISALDTVPFSLWCAIRYLDNFEEALWQTISVGGDADTTSAIVGGIVALYTGFEGIPSDWIQLREPLPHWAFEDSE